MRYSSFCATIVSRLFRERLLLVGMGLLWLWGCEGNPSSKVPVSDQLINRQLAISSRQLTNGMVFDIYSPPQASRIYAYTYLALYEVMAQRDSQYHSLAGYLHGFTGISPVPDKDIYLPVAALMAMHEVGKGLVHSDQYLEQAAQAFHKSLQQQGLSGSALSATMAYANQVAGEILAYANADGYDSIRSMQRYTPTYAPGTWQPTPPGYLDAIDPNWPYLRTFVLDSAAQFSPPPPTPFSTEPGTPFYREMMEVYDTVNSLHPTTTLIARFWDCNPYVAYTQGHFMMGKKKITPGGHWMGIAQEVCEAEKYSPLKSSAVMAVTAIALADGFISCWNTKYKTNYIRPETVINQLFDKNWRPILQTPPFPEYTSGHSVISTAAATVLTEMLGDTVDFTDSVEVPYGLPPRYFTSFFEASQEAAISRLYGGIHFRPAIENGVIQGKAVGAHVVKTLQQPIPLL